MLTSVLSLARGWGIYFALICAMLFNVSVFAQDQISESDHQSGKDTNRQEADAQELNKNQLDAIQIQMDTKGPIFLYDQSGGFRIAPPTKPAPDFQLFADGRVEIGGANYGMPKLKSKLSGTELTRFLNLIVNENRFYELNEQEIEKQMKAGKPKLQLRDAPTTRFEINLQQGKKEISVYALWNAFQNFPDVEELERLSNIEKACKLIITQTHLGDDGEKVLKAVNDAVAKLDQKIDPFTMAEIQNATRLTTGRFQVRFTRNLPASNGQTSEPKSMSAIYFRSDAKSEPQVNFYGLPKK